MAAMQQSYAPPVPRDLPDNKLVTRRSQQSDAPLISRNLPDNKLVTRRSQQSLTPPSFQNLPDNKFNTRRSQQSMPRTTQGYAPDDQFAPTMQQTPVPYPIGDGMPDFQHYTPSTSGKAMPPVAQPQHLAPPPYSEMASEDKNLAAATSTLQVSERSRSNDLDLTNTQSRLAATRFDEILEYDRDQHISNPVPLPIVIPQGTKSFRGAFFSPFVRAYVPELVAHGISESDFMTFIDGLNECWVANPAFQAFNVAGMIMQQFYGVHIVQGVGLGISVGAGFASAATSYARTRAFVKACNRDIFRPVGLTVNIESTKKMMAKVGMNEERLQLPPLDTMDQLSADAMEQQTMDDRMQLSQNDARMRRLKALEGYVMPLNFDVPEAESPDNFLKKMGHAQAQRMARKQQKKQDKRTDKAIEEQEKSARKIEKEERKGDKKIDEAERKLDREHRKMIKELGKSKAQKDPKEQRKIIKEFEREKSKLQREVDKEQRKVDKEVCKAEKEGGKKGNKKDKEQKATQKIRWITITKWEGDDSDESKSDSASLEEEDE